MMIVICGPLRQHSEPRPVAAWVLKQMSMLKNRFLKPENDHALVP